MPEEGEGRTIEEIRAAQLAHEAEIGEQEAARQAEADHVAALRAQTPGKIANRDENLKSLKELENEANALRDQGVEDYIVSLERIRKSNQSREEALRNTTEELEAARERLEALREMAHGKEEHLLSEELVQALGAAEEKYESIRRKFDDLSAELNEMKQREIPNEQIQRYQEIEKEMISLSENISDIELDKNVIELLMREAKTEDEIRDRLITSVILLRPDAERTKLAKAIGDDYLNGVCQRFFDEEVLARGIDELDDNQRIEAMRKMVQDILSVFDNSLIGPPGHIHGARNEQQRDNARNAVYLLSLTGRFGGADIAHGWLSQSGGSKIAGFRRHQGSINYAGAVFEALGPLAHNACRTYSHDSSSVGNFLDRVEHDTRDIRHGENGIERERDRGLERGPIFLKNQSPTEKKRILEEFDSVIERNREKATEILTQQIKEEQQKADELAKEIEKLSKVIDSLKEDTRLEKYISGDDHTESFGNLTESIRLKEAEISALNKERDSLGFFRRKKRPEVEDRIRKAVRELDELKEAHAQIKQVIEEQSEYRSRHQANLQEFGSLGFREDGYGMGEAARRLELLRRDHKSAAAHVGVLRDDLKKLEDWIRKSPLGRLSDENR